MKINRKTVLSTAAVLGVAALIAGGTIAYFTDNESADNMFKVGNVDVTLYESQLHRVNSNVAVQYDGGALTSPVSTSNEHNCANGSVYCTPNIAVSTDLSGVSAWQNGHVRAQNVAGQPGSGQAGVFSDAQIIADSTSNTEATSSNPGGYADYIADEYKNLVPGKQVRKFVYVKNTGENSAYVRVKVTIPASEKDLVTVKVPHTPTEESTSVGNTNIDGVAMGKYLTASESIDQATGDKVLTFIYTDALKKDEMTYWSPITTVKINDNVLESQLTNIDDLRATGFNIKVDVDAIQSDGFASAVAAFTAFDNQDGSENEHNV